MKYENSDRSDAHVGCQEGGVPKIKTKITLIVIIIFTIILIISSYFLIDDFIEYKESDNSNMKLIEDVIMQEKEDNKITIDWEKLERVSEDIVGWIKIEGTKIDYPIMKDNNSYKYLKKSFDGKYNKNGSIFTINYNPFEENLSETI